MSGQGDLIKQMCLIGGMTAGVVLFIKGCGKRKHEQQNKGGMPL